MRACANFCYKGHTEEGLGLAQEYSNDCVLIVVGDVLCVLDHTPLAIFSVFTAVDLPWKELVMALLSPGFHKWLSKRGLHPDTITVLQKESILQESTLKLLTDSDLDSIRKTHRITTGQFVLLRSAHSDLLEVDKDGFELVEMEDLPVQPKGASGQGQGSPTKKTGYKYRVKEKGQV